MCCGDCRYCVPNDVCNGDYLCTVKGIEVSKSDDTEFYGDNSETCKAFRPRSYTVCIPASLRELCIRENWFTGGTNEQYEKLFELNWMCQPLSEIALAIWLCTDGVSRGDIYDKLLDTSADYHERLAGVSKI